MGKRGDPWDVLKSEMLGGSVLNLEEGLTGAGIIRSEAKAFKTFSVDTRETEIKIH